MNFAPLPDASRLWELFSLDPLTGKLYRRVQTSPSTTAGELAGSYTKKYGDISVDHVLYRVHRIVYKWLTGKEPNGVIAHAADEAYDNRHWRITDSSQRSNCITKEELKGNNSVGVSQLKDRFYSRIYIKDRTYSLGCFATKEEAIATYNNAIEILKTNPDWRPEQRIQPFPKYVRRTSNGTFRGVFTLNGKRIKTTCFKTPEEAHREALAKRLELHWI